MAAGGGTGSISIASGLQKNRHKKKESGTPADAYSFRPHQRMRPRA
jgi:hypothetical protein